MFLIAGAARGGRGRPAARLRMQGGVSLIELMIAMTLGLMLIAGMTAMYLQNSKIRMENERISRQIENGRYAMNLLTRDLQMAGYYAELDPRNLSAPASKPDPCATGLSALAAAVPLQIQGYDNGANAPSCIASLGETLQPNTDIVVIRRVSSCIPGATNCDAQVANDYLFQASLCSNSSELGKVPATYFVLDQTVGNLILHKKNCTDLATIRRYITRIYFVAQNDSAGDGIPTLKRLELGPTGFTVLPLVEGVENLQIEYGLDTSPAAGDGAPDVFTADPDSYNSCSTSTSPTCVGYWQRVVAANLHLVSRTTQANPNYAYTDTKTYALGLNADGSANTVGPFNDHYERHVYEATVRMLNPSERSATQ